MNFIVSAPGKIILTGEHAVVYGYKAIASSINLRCQAEITTKNLNKDLLILRLNVVPFTFVMSRSEYLDLKLRLSKFNELISSAYQTVLSNFLDEKIKMNKDDEQFIKPGLIAFLDLYFQIINIFIPIDITITSEFSYGCGLGSSAAYSTVLSASFLLLSKKIGLINSSFSLSDLQLISDFAFRGEQIVHGTPSGIDNTISTFGNGIVFQRLSGSIIKKCIEIPNLPVLLVNTNVKRCTKSVVKHVNYLVQECPEYYHGHFSEIHKISEEMELLMTKAISNEANDDLIPQFNYLIEENQRILMELNVSHSTIEEIINILKFHGITSKLTGAGWGGCVYGIVSEISNEKLEEAISHLEKRGYGAHLTHLSCRGVDVIF